MVADPASESQGMVLLMIKAENRPGTAHLHLLAVGLAGGKFSAVADHV
jgi:hypothetical protein